MQLQILGLVRLQMHERVPVSTIKARGLLGVLAYRANELVPVSTLVEALWDGDRPAAAKNLQPHVSRLRRALADHDVPARVEGEHRAYRLEIDASVIDYHRFVAMTRSGYAEFRNGDYRSAAQVFETAVELWRGPAIADLDTMWTRTLQGALIERDLLPAYGALLDSKLRLGEHDFVITHLRRLLSDHPHHDQLAMLWMRTLAEVGRREEIPAYFRAFTRRVEEDLNGKPSRDVVRLYQELNESAVAASSASRAPNLPRETPLFTGRAAVLASLDAALLAEPGPTVVAVDGTPGVGKTAVVNHWVRHRHTEFPDGILRIDLAGYTTSSSRVEPTAAMASFLHQLGWVGTRIPEDEAARSSALRQAVAGRRVLVVVDNARDSAHVRPLLDALPVAVITTSRTRLSGLSVRDGATRITVPAMSVVESTALLVKRIGKRAIDEPAAVDDLCSLCGGLPLAIRLVAEYVADRPTPTLHELATELRRTREVLDAGAHGDDTDSTLRAAFFLSYNALKPASQAAFRQVGLQPTTTFSVPAVVALSSHDESHVQATLDELLSAHLIERATSSRYTVHDLLHRYARDLARQVAEDRGQDGAFRRLLDWYFQSASRARSQLVMDDHPIPDLPTDEVAPVEFPTPESARNWLLQERTALIAITYQAAECEYSEHVWRLAAALTVLHGYEDPRELIPIHRLGHAAACLIGDPTAAGGCLNNVGILHQRLGQHEEARRYFEEALEAFHAADYAYGTAACSANIGGILAKLGKPDQAVAWHGRALSLLAGVANPWATASVHRLLGDAYRALGEHELARTSYHEALSLSRRSGDLRGQGAALTALARLHLELRQFDEAIQIGNAALDHYDRVLDRANSAETLYLLAAAHFICKSYSEAATCAEQALRVYRGTRDRPGQARAQKLLEEIQGDIREHFPSNGGVSTLRSISAAAEDSPS